MICVAGVALAGGSLGAQVINVWPGIAPGSEHWTQKERTIENTPVGTVVLNVVTPTLTAYLPDPAKATGTAVIIAPGGAFVALATSLEGTGAARYLQQRGIAAFLLKYRTIEKLQDGIPNMDMDTAGRYGIADGIQALRVVRLHAAEWHVDPRRVGMIGFSAGGMVTSGALLQKDSAARPDFAAIIYGGPLGRMPVIPASLPPIFMAWAQDDAVALKQAPLLRSASRWRRKTGTVTHVFTHFPLELAVYTATVPARTRAPKGMRWVPIATLKDEALPSVMRKVIAHGLGE